MVNIKTLLGECFRPDIRNEPRTDHPDPPPSIRVDKATSPDHSEPDWESILDIVEEIKQMNVS